jgi:hypothetical protein
LHCIWRLVMIQQPTASFFFLTRIRGEDFAHFQAFPVRLNSSMRNWQFGPPGWILYEQSPGFQRKFWAFSLLCSSTVSPFSVAVNLDFPCKDHAFSPPPNSCLIISRDSVAHFPWFAQNVTLESWNLPHMYVWVFLSVDIVDILCRLLRISFRPRFREGTLRIVFSSEDRSNVVSIPYRFELLRNTFHICVMCQSAQCVCSIPSECGRTYIGETGRPFAVRLRKHKYNLKEGLL